jgi:hypothetical protein
MMGFGLGSGGGLVWTGLDWTGTDNWRLFEVFLLFCFCVGIPFLFFLLWVFHTYSAPDTLELLRYGTLRLLLL